MSTLISEASAPEIATISAALNLVPQEWRIDVLLFINKLIAKNTAHTSSVLTRTTAAFKNTAGTNTKHQTLTTHMRRHLAFLYGTMFSATANSRFKATAIPKPQRTIYARQVLSSLQRAEHLDQVYIVPTIHHGHHSLPPQRPKSRKQAPQARQRTAQDHNPI